MSLFGNNDIPGVGFERISILFSNTKFGYLGIFAGASFFGYIMWSLAFPSIALTWLGGSIRFLYSPCNSVAAAQPKIREA